MIHKVHGQPVTTWVGPQTMEGQLHLTLSYVFAEEDDAVGMDFTLMFPENAARQLNREFDVQLFLATHSDKTINVSVSMPLMNDERFPNKNVTVVKGNVTEVNYFQTAMHIGSNIQDRCVNLPSRFTDLCWSCTLLSKLSTSDSNESYHCFCDVLYIIVTD